VKTKHNMQPYQARKFWVLGACFSLLFPCFLHGQLFQVDQLSEPAGYLSESEAIQQGSNHPSVSPTLSSNGFAFGYWTINDVRQAGPDGRSQTQVSSVIAGATTYKAFYFNESEDSDSDGIKDWFEYRMWGDLTHGPTEDPDGDGFSNQREDQLGQDPLIFDQVEDGGIAGRLSNGFVYADTSMVLATIKSDPAGFVTETSNFQEMNSSVSTSSLHGETNGYQFAYWSVNGVRQAGPTGVSMSKVDQNITQTTNIIAHYLASSEDSDSDGVMDWFELYQFGNLNQGPNDDPDGDGFSNKREGELGQEATIVDLVEDGGIAGRLSTGFVYADTSMVLARVKSDPAGFVTESNTYLEQNGSLSTSSLHGETNGYQFAYWSVNGVRQAGPTGVASSKVDLNILGTTEVIAHYLPSTEDSDSDGVMDWFELYQFGNLDKGPDDDPDGDGFSNKREGELGQEATIFDLVEDGGIAGRLSTGVLYFQQQNRAPSNLELNSNIAYLNIEVNQTIGTFTPTDPDDPNLLRTYDISLVDGNGSTHNALFNLSGMQLRAAQTLTTEGNFSIRIEVSDDENASLEKNFTILAIDPLRDDDGDGLGYEAELIAGTNPNNPDSDGDGANDGSEVSAGTNPLDASLFPNRPPADLNSTAPLVIAENQPIGSFVGEFNATDPDGDPITYHLVSGDNNNSLFTLDTNGTLKTATTFDYESNASTYTVTIEAKDDENASIQGNFMVNIQDWFDHSWDKVTAPDMSAFDYFGASVSHSGNILAVGARRSDPDGVSGAGAAYLYQLEANGSATFLSKVTAPDKAPGDGFGYSVSQSGNILAVGANGSDPDGVSFAGAAYLYQLESNGSATFLSKVTAPDKAADDFFGYSVSQSGNILAVGAYGSDPDGLSLAGAAYLYQLESNGSATYLCKVTAPDKAASDQFGISVSQSGKILAVGANYSDPDGVSGAGAAYLYHLESNGSTTYLTKVTAPDKLASDNFGSFVSQSENILAVGAHGSDPDGLSNAGAAYLYQLEANGSATYLTKVTAPVKAASDFFGISVSQSDNILAVGAYGSDPDGVSGAGAAFTFDISSLILNTPPSNLVPTLPLSIPENQPIGTVIGEFNATDPDANATLSYSLVDGNGSIDNQLFTLEQNGTLKTATVFDFENNQSNYSIRVQVKDEYNASLEKAFSVELQNINENPVIHSANIGNNGPTLLGMVSVPENSTLVLEVNASDPDGNAVHFYKTAGLDRDQFDLNASTGVLTFKNPPDFENPTDADENNSYAVWFRAGDGNGGYSEKRLTVRVTNVVEDFDQDGIEDFYDLDDDNDGFSDAEEVAYGSDPRDQNSTANAAPQITLATEFPNQIGENGIFHIGHPENQSEIIRVTASDSDGDELHFSIFGEQNLPLFEINATTGDLRFKNSPDFENRGGHNKNGVYGVVIRVSDGKAHDEQPVWIWLQNQNEPPTDLNTSVPLEVLENQPAGSFVGNFHAIDPDANSTLTFSLVEGNQSDLNMVFILDPNGTLQTAVSFDYEFQSEEGNPLQILVRVSDEQNASLEKQFTVLILDEYEPIETPMSEDQNDSMDSNATLPPFIDGNYTEDNNGTLPPILDDNQSLVEGNSTLPPAIEPEPEPEFNPYAWIPIIQTEYPEILEDGSIRMSGRVLYDGGGNISEFGFLLAPTLRIKQHSPDTIRMEANGTVDGFTLIIPESPYPHRLYLQAYSMNEAGIGVGQRRRLKIPEAPLEWWGDAIQAEGDWLQSPWFGAFKYYERGWLYHGELGWRFASPAEDGVWLWGSANQWIWTNDGVYPYHYRWNDAGWGIWQRSESGVIHTYNYTTGRYED